MRLALSLLLALTLAAAGPIKLVLKDGTYQLVRSYERKGDRVKFFSIERNGWEEIPASLIDWKATEETVKRETEEDVSKAREISKQAEIDKTAASGLEIAPGINLPDEVGVYALSMGKVTTLPLSRAGTATDKGRRIANILLPAPVLKNRKLVTLPGTKAATRFAAEPEGLYVVGRASPTSQFILLRVKVKGDHRELEAISSWAFGGKAEHSGNQVQLNEQLVGKDTIRLVLRLPLAPGEYAIVELIDDKLNLYVADFGIGS